MIGYGNVYCHDDGVAFYIINCLRKQSGIRELQPDEDGLDELGHFLDTILLHQLVPEIIPVVIQFERVVFLDAHRGTIPDNIKVRILSLSSRTCFGISILAFDIFGKIECMNYR